MSPCKLSLFVTLGGCLVLGSATLGISQATKEARQPEASQPKDTRTWTDTFFVEKGELTATGRNPYFILEPGYVLVLQKGSETMTKTVLAEIKMVDGVETRVIEEKETKDGKVVEISRNFYALSKRNNSVYYFGEEVDIYEDGKVTSHAGAWLSGEKGAKFGLMMPGTILVGGRHYQEIAPKVATDRAEIVSMAETLVTPAGTFKNCVKVEESSSLDPDTREHKYYAPGVGLVKDDKLVLVKYGFLERAK